MTSLLTNLYRLTPFCGSDGPQAGRMARVFRRYQRYKQIRLARYPWNALAHSLRWSLASREAVTKWTDQRLQLEDNAWIFIAGCNNSGTTLLREVLGSHAFIRALPREGQTLTEALPRPTALGVPRLFGLRLELFRWTEESDAEPVLKTKYDWSRYFPRRPGHLLVKSPENTVRTRWLQRHFHPCRFVAIVRSPYAVCEGTRRRNGHAIEDAAVHWTRVNECLLSDAKHLEHCKLFRYEDFCERPLGHLHQLEEFLQLDTPFSSDALKARKVHNIDKTSSGIFNFNAKSLEHLSRTDLDAINDIAGPLMDQLGYERV